MARQSRRLRPLPQSFAGALCRGQAAGGSLDDRVDRQTLNYANAAGVEWCVLTNGAEWRIYKVHAQVDAEEKRFATATIDQPRNLDDAARVLTSSSRDSMRCWAIDELWQAWHVDRQVQQALEQTLQEDAFASLILRKRVPQLTLTDVRESLRQANIAISYPGLIADLQSARQVPRPASTPAGTSTNGAAPAPRPGGGRESTDDLFALGRLAAGTTLTIRGREEDSAARVLDGQTVEFKANACRSMIGASASPAGPRSASTPWPACRMAAPSTNSATAQRRSRAGHESTDGTGRLAMSMNGADARYHLIDPRAQGQYDK